jgi:opacity protein-like surface antigen
MGHAKRLGFCFLLSLAVTSSTATPAQAQWIATPYLGVNLAGDAELRRGGVAGAVGFLGGKLGVEFDVERHHHFFKDRNVDVIPNNCGPAATAACTDLNTRAWRFMGNVIVPLRGKGAAWRPYASAGAGVIRPWIQGPGDLYDVSQSDPAFSVGAGVMRTLSDRFALRADLRYLRGMVDESQRTGAYFRDYGFVHATVGVTIRLLGN